MWVISRMIQFDNAAQDPSPSCHAAAATESGPMRRRLLIAAIQFRTLVPWTLRGMQLHEVGGGWLWAESPG
jgi:hypothetical protein